jgi:tRNA threonylcarbamoyladenosine biosynthesis protein TsaB
LKLLSLSTAEKGCSLAVTDGAGLVCEEFWTSRLTHSRRLVKMIEQMLDNRAGMELADIDGFVAARGPGSFTGVRIGIAVVQGLSFALEKPCAGVSSLDGIAWRFSHSSHSVCAMMDARRNEVYSAVYQFERGRLTSKTREQVVSPQKAVDMAKASTVFAGSGSKAYREIIEKTADNPVIAHEFMDSVSATALVRSLTSTGTPFDHPENVLTPSYIRQSDAELQFLEKSGH